MPATGISMTSPMANNHAHNWESLTVRPGDNLSLIFDRLHINRQDLDKIMSLGMPATALKYLMPDHELRVQHANGELLAMEYDMNLTDTILVRRQDVDFVA